MYPLGIVLISCSESESSATRLVLANLAVNVAGEFGDADKAIHDHDTLAKSKCVFFVRVKSATDLNMIRRLVYAFPCKPILAMMNTDSDTLALLSTQRAGAVQTALVPLQGEDIQAALATIALLFGYDSGISKIIAVTGITEGAGATSLAINLAVEIAWTYKIACILVELSSGLGRLATYLNLEPKSTTHDLLGQSAALELIQVKESLVKVGDDISVLAGPFRSVSTVVPSPVRILQLLECLRHLASIVVLDLPYEFGQPYLSRLTGADHIVLVGDQTVPSVHDLKLVSGALDKAGGDAARHLVISRFHSSDHTFSQQRLQEVFQIKHLWTVAHDPAFKEALNQGKLLRHLAPHSPALHDVASLTRELLGKEETPSRSHVLFDWLGSLAGFSRTKDVQRSPPR